ncbi:MAG: quinone oxidoreductase [Chloroflexales bacterium]|nr:quinone oxidoreductase [Chloroflexales bacterium]
MQAMRIDTFGGPEVLRLVEIPEPVPGPGEALVRHSAIGVNFVDTQHRAGTPYPVTLPLIPGVEAAGVVVALGPGVTEVHAGDRVAHMCMAGVYATHAAIPAAQLVPVPDGLELRMAAASLMQGTTAHYLSHSTYPLGPGDTALVLAAAGGVGQLLAQFAKRRGATVIAVVSSEAKARVARARGADHVVVGVSGYAAEARRLTGGRGVDVVYDSIGRTTFEESLTSLRPRGLLAAYGQASGPVPPFEIVNLAGFSRAAGNGSLFITWSSNSDYCATREELLWRADDVFNGVLEGTLCVEVAGSFSLGEAAHAHRLLESRVTTGKLILLP